METETIAGPMSTPSKTLSAHVGSMKRPECMLGKWHLVKSENFENYLKAVGELSCTSDLSSFS
jgi:hypothetical protein